MLRFAPLFVSIAALSACAGTTDGLPSIAPEIAQAGPAELETRAAIDRVRAYNPSIGAVISLNPDAIDIARSIDRSGERGPLVGVPVLIKDNIETADAMATTAGSLALADNVTGRDSPLVTGLREAGAVILGKANLSEWANIRSSDSISGWSAIGGQVRNPWALDRNPCGSSSGSAAAVAAGMVDHAVGTETNGSVACPAAINGIVGFKPTVGLISRRHIVPISVSQDTAGPMTRTVRQAADMLTAMAGSDPQDAATAEADARKVDYAAGLDDATLAGKRFGVMRFASGFGTDERLEEAIALLEAQGAEVIDITEIDRGPIFQTQLGVLLTELKVEMNAYLASLPGDAPRTLAELIAFNEANADDEMPLFGQDLFEQAEATDGYNEEYRANQRRGFEAAGPNGIDRLLAEHDLDALIGPTMPAAWPIDPVHGDQISGGGGGGLAAVAGYPHLTVPMGFVRGLPVGLSFIGGQWEDAKILALGHAYEQARGPLPRARFLPSVNESDEVTKAFAPADL